MKLAVQATLLLLATVPIAFGNDAYAAEETNQQSNSKSKRRKQHKYKYSEIDGVFPLQVRAKRHAEDFQRKEDDDLLLTPPLYLKRRRPSPPNQTKSEKGEDITKYCRKDIPKPTVVSVSLHITEVSRVHDGHISFASYLTYSWSDYRFEDIKPFAHSDYVELFAGVQDDIWVPDLFIPNSVDVAKPIVFSAPMTFRVYTNKSIFATQYMFVSVVCPFQFNLFPMDMQVCDITLQSFGSPPCEILLVWADREPLTYSKSTLPQFSYEMYRVEPDENLNVFNTASLSYLKRSQLHVHIVLRRNSMFYMWQIYTPSLLFIIVSCVSIMIPKEMAQGRMLLTITTMLTMVSLFAATSDYIPKVSYMKAIDVWMCVCTFMSFLAVVNVLIDLYIEMFNSTRPTNKNTYVLSTQARRQTVVEMFRKYVQRRHVADTLGEDVVAAQELSSTPLQDSDTAVTKIYRALHNLHKSAGITLPIFFVAFNIVYWGYLLVMLYSKQGTIVTENPGEMTEPE